MVDGVSDDVRDVMIDQRVHGLSSLALDSDEPGASEHPKMLGYQWLAHLQLIDQFVDCLLYTSRCV